MRVATWPGNNIESLNIGTTGATLSFKAGSNFDYEIKSNNSLATAADLVNLTGDLGISSTAAINFADLAGLSAMVLPANTKFTLIAYSGPETTEHSLRSPTAALCRSAPMALSWRTTTPYRASTSKAKSPVVCTT